MNTLIIAEQKTTMTSREIAEISGKRHTEVLRSIRVMEPAWEKVSGRNFALAKYIDEQGKPRPEYRLDFFECMYVATKFNDEARAKLVIRWKSLELQAKHNRCLPENVGEYPENTVITVQMGRYSNQIYVTEGVIFAKLAPIARYIGYDTAPTYYLERLGKNNYRKIMVGKYDAWFINAKAFAELIKHRNNTPFSKIKTIYKDLFAIDKQNDNESPYTYRFTDSQMLDIVMQINQKPISKTNIIQMLYEGKRE